MDQEKSRKKRKSGHEFRKEKQARQREEAAVSCAKITAFCVPHAQTDSSSAMLAEVTQTSCIPEERTDQMEVVGTNEEALSENTESNVIINKTYLTENLNLEPRGTEDNQSNAQEDNINSIQCTNVNEQSFEEVNKVDFFKKPQQTTLDSFFSFHPVQPIKDGSISFQFEHNIFYVKHNDGQSFKRQWLSYNVDSKKLYCTVCLAFSDDSSVFCRGFDRFRHVNQTLGEHEKSKAHVEAVKTYIAYKQGRTVDILLFQKQFDKMKKEVLERRQVLSSIYIYIFIKYLLM